MNRYIIGGIIIIGFVWLAVSSFDASKIEYDGFSGAKLSGQTVQVIGTWIKDKEMNYDSKKNTFTFWMEDEQKNASMVIYDGAKPNNFEMAQSVVIKGKYEGEDFYASEILTKCPSKYEGTADELNRQHPDYIKIDS